MHREEDGEERRERKGKERRGGGGERERREQERRGQERNKAALLTLRLTGQAILFGVRVVLLKLDQEGSGPSFGAYIGPEVLFQRKWI